jgi:hypothetical protein
VLLGAVWPVEVDLADPVADGGDANLDPIEQVP